MSKPRMVHFAEEAEERPEDETPADVNLGEMEEEYEEDF